MRSSHQAVIALGANLGEADRALIEAMGAISELPHTHVIASSRIFRTAPIGGPEQPDYQNAVAIISTQLTPMGLLDALHVIENAHGRERGVRWGPRTLDLDIITFDDLRSDDPYLTLPHPRAHERAFVLMPWCDADPNAQWVDGRRIDAMVTDLGDQDCVAASTQRVHEMVGS